MTSEPLELSDVQVAHELRIELSALLAEHGPHDILEACEAAALDELAGRLAQVSSRIRDTHHAAFHGRTQLRYGCVEVEHSKYAREGRVVCLDCAYGHEWPGMKGAVDD